MYYTQARYTEATGVTRPVEVTGCDRERAVKAYVEVLEEEGLWVDPGFKWDPTCPSISIIARHVATLAKKADRKRSDGSPNRTTACVKQMAGPHQLKNRTRAQSQVRAILRTRCPSCSRWGPPDHNPG